MANQIRLLAADADLSVREIIRLAAAEQGWACESAKDGISALKLVRRNQYHLAVVEVELPEINGLIVCRQLRKTPGIPVILIARDGRENSRLEGFAAGGNDYVLKPFYPHELMARVRNLLELCGMHVHPRNVIAAGELRIEADSRTVTLAGKRLQLSPKEYDLLLFFCKNADRAFSRDSLLDLVWGTDFEGTDRTVDTHIKSLRSKLAPYQSCIETVWGFGYKFSI